MNGKKWRATLFLAATCLWLPAAAVAGPILGQVDDFEDGTTQGWTINAAGLGAPPSVVLPQNVSTGGPAGLDDNYLLLTSLGGTGSGSRLSVLNSTARWTDDYLAAGVNAITIDVQNLGATDLFLRLALEDPVAGPPSNIAFSTQAVLVPSGGGWQMATFLLRPDHLTAGLGTVNAALTGATVLRLYHSPSANSPNPVFPIASVSTQLGVDNITAANLQSPVVPEPASFTIAVLGLAGLAGGALRQRTAGRLTSRPANETTRIPSGDAAR